MNSSTQCIYNNFIFSIMKKSIMILAALALLGSAACTKTEIKEVEVEKVVEKVVDLLSLTATQLQVGNEGVVQPIAFTTEDAWTITSDQDWVTFDKASGAAGSSTVNMTVAKNPDFATRTARVTLSVTHENATKTTVFTVVQSEEQVFSTSTEYRIDFEEQDIAVDFNTNLTPEVKVVEGDWLSVTRTKAAPVDGKIIVHATKNDGAESRTGSFTIAAGSIIQTYVVVQASQYASASEATALYLGNLQDMYDDENYVFKDINQFVIQFAAADGDVTLVLNGGPELADATKIPAGEYKMDETGQYAAGTFSVQGRNEKYYTTVTAGGKDMTLIDGTVNVSQSGDTYTVIATLVDEFGTEHMYSYKGQLAITDDSFGAQVTEAADKGLYNTYFATKADEVKLSLRINKAPEGTEHWLSYIIFTMFRAHASADLPLGKLTYEVPEQDSSLGYANGITQGKPGTFYISSAGKKDWEDGISYRPKDGTTPTLEITKQDDGRYTVKLDATISRILTTYDDDSNAIETETESFPYKAVFKDLTFDQLSEPDQFPCPDGDRAFSFVNIQNNYMPMWFGDRYDTGCHVFLFGWNFVDSEYNVYLAINVKDDDWVFEKNFAKRFCNTPFNLGTFNFSWTPAENTLIPVRYGNTIYHAIENRYTGHIYQIVGGSITMDATSIKYDLTATYEGKTFKFTGGHPATLYYIRDLHTSALNLDTQ